MTEGNWFQTFAVVYKITKFPETLHGAWKELSFRPIIIAHIVWLIYVLPS